MPAAPMAMRRYLLSSSQESETLQYKAGVKTSNMKPISWHSPPKCLQARPCPNSCSTLTTAIVMPNQIQFLGPKNSWKSGSRERKTSNCAPTRVSADKPNRQQTITAAVVNIHQV